MTSGTATTLSSTENAASPYKLGDIPGGGHHDGEHRDQRRLRRVQPDLVPQQGRRSMPNSSSSISTAIAVVAAAQPDDGAATAAISGAISHLRGSSVNTAEHRQQERR